MQFENFNPKKQSEDLEEEVEYVEIKAFEYYQEQFEHSPENALETILKDDRGNISEVLSFIINKEKVSNTKDLDKSLNYIIQNSEIIHDNILQLLECRKDLPDNLRIEWNDFVENLLDLLNEELNIPNIIKKSKGISYEDIPNNTEFKLAIKKGQYEATKTEANQVIRLIGCIESYSKNPQIKKLLKEMKLVA